ncbi:MAG: thioredoxin family protein [Pirellulaceae bacterium]
MNDTQSDISLPDGSESPLPRKPFFHFWRSFWLTFLVASLAYAGYCFYVPSNDIAWADDYASAQRQAARTGRPIILYFTGTWCVPCRIMKRQVWADEQVRALVNAEFVPVAIDVDAPESAELMTTYQVKGPPVTIVCNPKGTVVDWRAGGISKTEFLELLDSSN